MIEFRKDRFINSVVDSFQKNATKRTLSVGAKRVYGPVIANAVVPNLVDFRAVLRIVKSVLLLTRSAILGRLTSLRGALMAGTNVGSKNRSMT
jgi:hypothetical protein